MFFLLYLCVSQQLPSRTKEKLQTLVSALEGQWPREEDNYQDYWQCGCEIPHLCRRLDGLPYGEVDQYPSHYQIDHQLPSQNTEFLDARAQLQYFVAAIFK